MIRLYLIDVGPDTPLDFALRLAASQKNGHFR